MMCMCVVKLLTTKKTTEVRPVNETSRKRCSAGQSTHGIANMEEKIRGRGSQSSWDRFHVQSVW